MHRRTARRLTLCRWGFLLAALVIELVWLTVRFDLQSLASARSSAADWLLYAVYLPRCLIACLAALAIMGGGRLTPMTSRLFDDSVLHLRWWLGFACHLAAFAGLVSATAWIFEDRPRSTALPIVWTAGWFILAAATLGFWLITLAPIASWIRLVRLNSRELLAGVGAGLAASWAGAMTQRLWPRLCGSTFFALERLLRAVYRTSEVASQPADQILGLNRGLRFEVSPQCSGYEGFGIVTVLMLVFLWTNRERLRFPQSLLLVPAGIAIVWLANALRIAALFVLANHWSREIAVGCFHSPAGWLLFNLIAVTIAAVSPAIPFFARRVAGAGPGC
jgi:exosortase/archaeosortase family protein